VPVSSPAGRSSAQYPGLRGREILSLLDQVGNADSRNLDDWAFAAPDSRCLLHRDRRRVEGGPVGQLVVSEAHLQRTRTRSFAGDVELVVMIGDRGHRRQ
jgi:hypothetical protein